MGRPGLQLAGKRFGRLTTIEPVGKQGKGILWLCLCDCGKESVVLGSELNGNRVRSCGCLSQELAAERGRKRLTTHGLSHSRLYKIWVDMLSRCENKNVANYERYGGRGIKVCEEWHNFELFATWAFSNGYAEDLSIDRENVNGNYEPGNCKWATRIEQQNNRRDSTRLAYNGETHTLPEWERITGINRSTLRSRVRNGWSPETILNSPKRLKKGE